MVVFIKEHRDKEIEMTNFNINLSGPFMDEVTPEGLAEALREYYGLKGEEVKVEAI